MDDLISRKAVIDKAITIPIAKIVTEDKVIYRRIVFVEDIENLPSVHPTVHDLPKDADTISRQAAKLKVARVIWEDGDSCYDFHDKCVDCLDDVPSAQPENNIVSNSGREPTKNDIIMLYHKVYGCTIINAEQAHEKALEYLRDKAMLKG